MANLSRILELAGIKEKSLKTKQLHESSLEELENQRHNLEQQLKGCTILTEHVDNLKFQLLHVDKAIQNLQGEGINEELKQIDGKWALVSKKTGRPLRYYKGEGKPSEDWVHAQEQSIQYFKNGMKEATNPTSGEGSVVTKDTLEMPSEAKLDEVAPEDQEDFVKKSKEDFKKRYGKRWKNVLYATAWKKHKNEATDENYLEIADKLFEAIKDAGELQDMQPTAAAEKDEIDNVFNDHDEEKANAEKLHQDAMGVTQDRETKVEVPKDVLKQIDQRIKELKASIEMYDKTTYVEHYGNKQKAIENLEFIRDKLKMGNMEGFKQAQIMYSSLASMYFHLFPAKLVDFLHDGMADEQKEVAFGDYMKGNKDKPEEKDVPGNAIYKTLNTSIYPQKGEDNIPK